MEADMSKPASTIVMALLFVCSAAPASDWISVPLTNPSKVAMIDNDSVFISGSVRRAWFKLVMPPHSKKGVGIYENRYLAYALMRTSFDCQQKNSMTDGLQWFYEDGTNNMTAAAAEWAPVAPDSMADALFSYICSWKSK
jgi:hypothetical protein